MVDACQIGFAAVFKFFVAVEVRCITCNLASAFDTFALADARKRFAIHAGARFCIEVAAAIGVIDCRIRAKDIARRNLALLELCIGAYTCAILAGKPVAA